MASRLTGSSAAERLVHQQHRRIDGERARDADALRLPAGELVRIAVEELRGLQRQQRQQLLRAPPRLAAFHPSRRGTTPMFSATVMFGNSPICWIT